jgi:hypothetical protein
VSDIKRALIEAIEGLHDFSRRMRGMRLNRSQSEKSWSGVFNENFFHSEMSGFFGTDPQIVFERMDSKLHI